jgi:MoxR-like ATPase
LDADEYVAAREETGLMPELTFEALDRLQKNIGRVVLGKSEVIRLTAVAVLAAEHLLLEDVPGVGKTLLAKALARSLQGKFSRVQFTPDLLPSDITGSSIYRSDAGDFQFSPGPVFTNVLLADEINRAPPRTQSALLESMSERQVSVDGHTHPIEPPFLVIATQNPFEYEGTYLLPESQLDRFLLRIQVGYPDRRWERQALQEHRLGEPVDQLAGVVTCQEVLAAQAATRQVRVEDSVLDYLQDIVEATRTSDEVHVGVSIRGSLALYRAAQAMALLDGREYMVPDDVKVLAKPVLAHRVIPRGFAAGSDRSAAEEIIERIMGRVPVPV